VTVLSRVRSQRKDARGTRGLARRILGWQPTSDLRDHDKAASARREIEVLTLKVRLARCTRSTRSGEPSQCIYTRAVKELLGRANVAAIGADLGVTSDDARALAKQFPI
jgi:hypothetical protein